MANPEMVVCIDDKVYKWTHNLKRGGVYTVLKRIPVHCSRARGMVFVAEATCNSPRIGHYKCRCGKPIPARTLGGSFWDGRFRPMLPPEQLGITTEQVQKLYNSPRVRAKEKVDG